MAWNYSGDPAASTLDQVRFLIGDTDDTDHLLQDAEIEWLIDVEASVYEAAAVACEQIVVSNRLQDKQIDGLRISAGQRADHYNMLADRLRRRGGTFVGVFGGGVSLADKRARADASDVRTPAFSVGQFDNTLAGPQQGSGHSHVDYVDSTGTV